MNLHLRSGLVVCGLVWSASVGLACASSNNHDVAADGGATGSDAHADGAPSEGGLHLLGDAASDAAGAFNIQPQNPTLTVTVPGAPATEHFQVFPIGSTTPAVVTWSIDNPELGTIDGNGNFTASGTAGGSAHVTAQGSTATASTTLTILLNVSENPGNVSSAVQTQLQAGGSADSTFTWLYPYDQTVFPRGLTPPVLQFAGTTADATYVHITSSELDYTGYFTSSTGPTQVTLSASTWTAISETAGGTDTLKVAVTKISGGQVSGPITETWTIAQGSLKGTVYYNSYDSALGDKLGTVLKMKPGISAAAVLVGGASGCQVCHAVSDDGSTLTVSNASYATGTSYSLSAAGATMMYAQPTPAFSFAGLYPDGSRLLTNGAGPIPGTEGTTSQLMNPATGAIIPAPGFDGVVTNALMPTFSPDGKKVVFNHYDTGMGHTIAVMDFAAATNTFSGLVDVTTDATYFLGWPAFLPDSAEFVFHADTGADFATWSGDMANIEMVDLATQTMTPLDALNGIANGQIYLPYGMDDANLNYEPTVLPVAVGGYYWVVFTSRREYGNTITEPNAWQQSPAIRKKLWIAAIDLNPKPGTDPSHPAFYINDQELEAGNMRGFWTLDPCQQNGATCASGDECCSGFCRGTNSDGGISLTCVPPTGGCAQEFEKCTVASDCCGVGQGYQCINGFCAEPAAQ